MDAKPLADVKYKPLRIRKKSYFCDALTLFDVNKKTTQCPIPLYSLKNGEHEFHFDLPSSVFSDNHYDDIHAASIHARISFNKNSSIFIISFVITGTVNVTCDRCGDDFDMPIDISRQLIVKTGCSVHQEEDDMVSLTSSEYEFDAAPYIYQYVALWLPMQRIHPADVNGKSLCNATVLEKLDSIHKEKSHDEQYILDSSRGYNL